jgi:regulatory protein
VERRFLTKEQALQKLKQFCNYQERSHFDVTQKLWELAVAKKDHDEIISSLIEDDYLNEERFAKLFAGGKFRMKDWGRRKITQSLKEKKVSSYIIKTAMKEIDDEAYQKKAKELIEKKYASLTGEQYLVRKKKTFDYLLQKGYEPEVVANILDKKND